MPEHEQPTSESTARHLQEYVAGVAGKPPKLAPDDEAAPVRFVTLESDPPRSSDTARPAEAAVVSEADEISRLRQLLHQKDHAIFRSVVKANELKTELDATK